MKKAQRRIHAAALTTIALIGFSTVAGLAAVVGWVDAGGAIMAATAAFIMILSFLVLLGGGVDSGGAKIRRARVPDAGGRSSR